MRNIDVTLTYPTLRPYGWSDDRCAELPAGALPARIVRHDGHALQNGFAAQPRMVTFGGGYPIIQDGAAIGAIGVSGGHYSDDMEVARAGLAAIGAPVT